VDRTRGETRSPMRRSRSLPTPRAARRSWRGSRRSARATRCLAAWSSSKTCYVSAPRPER
jgi:hypothetical protein